MTQLLPPKKEVALALLERSNVDVYLDPRAKGVVVPPQFRKEPRLILKIGLNMPVPIPDLRLDDESMSCTLSFNRSPFYCVVPWTSVFAMVGEDGRGMVWPDDVPQELAVKVVEPTEGAASRDRGDGPATSTSASSSSNGTGSNGTGPAATGRRGESSRRASTRDRAAQAQADDSADRPASASSRGGAAGKAGKRKKKEEGPPRPVLVAVPNAPSVSTVPPVTSASSEVTSEASGSERPRASERPREIRQPPESRRPANPDGSRPRDGVSAVPSRPRQPAPPSQRRPPPPGTSGQGADGPARPKRELPPYLRVVK
jgi:stringent starvation protein B